MAIASHGAPLRSRSAIGSGELPARLVGEEAISISLRAAHPLPAGGGAHASMVLGQRAARGGGAQALGFLGVLAPAPCVQEELARKVLRTGSQKVGEGVFGS